MLLVEFGVGSQYVCYVSGQLVEGELVCDTIGRMGTAGLCILGSP